MKKPSEDRLFDDWIAATATNPFIQHDLFPIPSTGRQEYQIEARIEAGEELVSSEHSVSFSRSDTQQALVIAIAAPDDVSVVVETF